MHKKIQSKSDEKALPLNNQKKPLPKPDTSLRQTMYKRAHRDTGQLIKGSTETPGRRTAYKRIHKDAGKIKRHK